MKKALVILMVLSIVIGFIPEARSCRHRLPWRAARCAEIEQAILASTVRIIFQGWIEVENGNGVERINGSTSHATVIDGRYLLTHNHFGVPLSRVQLFNRYAARGFDGVSVLRLDGSVVLEAGSLDAFTVVSEVGETVLLDFGEGFFARAGVPSAVRARANDVELYPGAEVALIDWDKAETWVVWGRVELVQEEDGLPVARVDHFIEKGSSGGGVFLNGVHIGNNRGRIIQTNRRTDEEQRRLSLVALNPH
jgi:hypothetical protein